MFAAINAFAHSDAFKPQFVDTLIQSYLNMQKGLAGDDLKEAKAGASSFLKAMEQAPQGSETKEEVADLINPAKAIAEASTIKAARTAFLDLSMQMKSLITHVGITRNTKLYLTHCPMAFDGKGGAWIQADKTVANPYYGSMMLKCGSVKAQITGEKDDAHDSHGGHGSTDAHSGHGH